MKTKTLVVSAVLSALSVLLVYVLHFPIFPSATFLEYDPADIPIFLGTLLYGPGVGLIITVISAIIQGVTVSAQGGVIGIMMHIIATGSFVLTAGIIFKLVRTNWGLTIAIFSGILAWIVMMMLWNIFLTPIFMGVSREAVIKMLLPIILPFNLFKACVNATLATIIYKILVPRLSKSLGIRMINSKKIQRPPLENLDNHQ